LYHPLLGAPAVRARTAAVSEGPTTRIRLVGRIGDFAEAVPNGLGLADVALRRRKVFVAGALLNA
jgi:hypothetical protein